MALIIGRVVLILAVFAIIAGGGMAMRGIDFSGYDNSTILIGAVVGVVVIGAVGLFVVEGVITVIERSYEKGGAEHQIWARHLNTDILLFATRDKLRFGKIYRALQRAMERPQPIHR